MKSLSNSIFNSKRIEDSSKVYGGNYASLTTEVNTCVLSDGEDGHVKHDSDKKDQVED